MSGPIASVIILEPAVSEEQIAAIRTAASGAQPTLAVARGDGWAAMAFGSAADHSRLEEMPGVRRIVQVDTPYRIASRAVFDRDIGVRVGDDVGVGADAPISLMATSGWAAGNDVRLSALAPSLVEAGCRIVHIGRPFAAGAGADPRAVERLRDIARDHALAVSLEVSTPAEIGDAAAIADVLQIGSHNMQDFNLLRELGRCDLPVILKRGAGATVEEFLLAAEYVLTHGNGRVILCEAGIRTFDALAKPRFEINAIALLKRLTHLPVIADPSRCAPSSSAIPALAKAAVAAGADGLMMEVGTESVEQPDAALIGPETLRRLVVELGPIARAVGRRTTEPVLTPAAASPAAAIDVLHQTDRTLAQVMEGVIGVPPQLDVIDQWRIAPHSLPTALTPPFDPADTILARCTGYRTGYDRLSRNLAFVDLDRIDPTLAALLETGQVNLGQLFVDPRITKLGFEFGTDTDAGDIHATLERCFPSEELRPYLWRRYHAAIEGQVVFVVIESLPVATWDRILRTLTTAGTEGR